MVSVDSFQKKMRQCVPFTALWYWTFFFCVQTYAGISVVKYCHTCDLQSHGTDLFGPFLW